MLNMNITATTLNFHIIFNVDSVALIFLNVANCSQASWKIDMFDACIQSTVFVDERERERERERGVGSLNG
jgi:hypothetical protein